MGKVTIKIGSKPITGMTKIEYIPIPQPKHKINFEVAGDYPIEIGMEVAITQPGAEHLNGQYIIVAIEGHKVWLDSVEIK